jgi:hypothetical protein
VAMRKDQLRDAIREGDAIHERAVFIKDGTLLPAEHAWLKDNGGKNPSIHRSEALQAPWAVEGTGDGTDRFGRDGRLVLARSVRSATAPKCTGSLKFCSSR